MKVTFDSAKYGKNYMQGYEHGFSKQQAIIDKQAAEIEALRGFAEEVLDNLHRPCRLYLTELAQKWQLFDEHVQPTKLLTGGE